MIKISIIIPAYNVGRYIDRCVKSIVGQTLGDLEIIIVDDCSPDCTPQVCDEWAKSDSRIKVIHKEKNEGLGFARNTGLDVASGEYVAFVDSDDYVDISMYEVLYNKAITTDSDIVYCGVKQEVIRDRFIDVADFEEERSYIKKDLRELSIRYIDPPGGRKLFMSVWHSIYKRTVIGDLRFYSERVVCSEDLPFQIAMLLKASKVTYIPDALYYYCLNENSLSKTFDFNKCFKYFTLAKTIESFYPSELKFHVWRFFFTSCLNFIRILVRSKLSRNEKYAWLRKLCRNKEITDKFRAQKLWLDKKPHNRLYLQYYYFITHEYIKLLYLTALIDQRVICDKLGLKK